MPDETGRPAMPDETRVEALEAMAQELSRLIYAMWTDAAVKTPGGLRRAMSDRILAALRTVQQDTARETWERAAQIADASQLVGRPRNRGEDCWNRAARLIARTLRDQLPVLQVAATPTEDQR